MAIADDIRKLGPWFQNIHLPDGTQTAPDHFLGDYPAYKWEKLQASIPHDLSGWKVLDVGCNAGFHAVELARRGAQVTGIDLDGHYLEQARWIVGQFAMGDRISLEQLQVYDLPRSDEKYDLIWFTGVLYHLRYPMLALDILSQKVEKLLVVQSLMPPIKSEINVPPDLEIDQLGILGEMSWPSLYFIEHRVAGDPTNWWIPNHSGLEAMLRSCGLAIQGIPDEQTFIATKDRAAPSGMQTWNRSEYLSAIGSPWQEEVRKKTGES